MLHKLIHQGVSKNYLFIIYFKMFSLFLYTICMFYDSSLYNVYDGKLGIVPFCIHENYKKSSHTIFDIDLQGAVQFFRG